MVKSKFNAVWQSWKRIAIKIGDAQARIILTVFYVVIVGPFALVIRFWSDPLRLNPRNSAGWIRRPDDGEPAEKRAREQFHTSMESGMDVLTLGEHVIEKTNIH